MTFAMKLQQELLSARRQIDSQATQILSLEAALQARPVLPPDAPDSEKDKLIADQTKTIRELEIVIRGYEENLGEPLRAVREDVEHEYEGKLEEERKKREEKEAWAEELVKQLEIEKAVSPSSTLTHLQELKGTSARRARNLKERDRRWQPSSQDSTSSVSVRQPAVLSLPAFGNPLCPHKCSDRPPFPPVGVALPTEDSAPSTKLAPLPGSIRPCLCPRTAL